MSFKNKTKGRLDFSSKQIWEQFKNYQVKYSKAHSMSISTWFGITNDDKAKGINSLIEKLESRCPFYSHMEEIFGKTANITPLTKYDTQRSESNDREEISTDPHPRNINDNKNKENYDWPASDTENYVPKCPV